jgi:class 3 adenylate cyclase
LNKDSVKKKALIAEILGMMEKADKDKYWLLERIQSNRLDNIQVSPAMSRFEILDACPEDFLTQLADTLRHLSLPEYELPKYANTYHWFFTDIVASANPEITTDDQTRKIIALNDLIRKTQSFKTRVPDSTIILPTGDGYAIGFKDTPEKPLLLAVELHKALNEYNVNKVSKDKIEVRIGLHTGPVYPIMDLNDTENMWGPGIIYARRIMDLGRAKSILASDTFANDVKRLKPEFKKIMHLIGNYPIKHGENIAIYNIYGNIYGSEIGTKKNPIARRVEKSAVESEVSRTINTFVFSNVEIILKITNPKTMMAHHTWIWHMINQTDQPVDRVFYYLDGDVPRNFPDLNLRVTDNEGNELPIESLNVNRPYRKEFFVKLSKPFKPRQKGRFVKLEYDWEEKERHFFYRFASECKKFRFLLITPKGMSLKQKVSKVSPETGERILPSIPATVKYLKDRVEVEWQGDNIQSFDAYRFDW